MSSRTSRWIAWAVAAAVMAPGIAGAGSVMLKNKDSKEVTIIVKRSGSRTETGIAGKTTMELPGAPVTVILKKTNASIDADDGETIVIEKGKLSKLPAENAEDTGVPATPDSTPASTPTPAPAASPTK